MRLSPFLDGFAAAVHDYREVPFGDHGLHRFYQPKQKCFVV